MVQTWLETSRLFFVCGVVVTSSLGKQNVVITVVKMPLVLLSPVFIFFWLQTAEIPIKYIYITPVQHESNESKNNY